MNEDWIQKMVGEIKAAEPPSEVMTVTRLMEETGCTRYKASQILMGKVDAGELLMAKKGKCNVFWKK